MLARRGHPRRFNLVLLTENEHYISDYICVYGRGGHAELSCPGRLKLASQSLFIDPDSYEHPVYRFRFKDIESLEMIDIEAGSRSDHVTNALSGLAPTGCSAALVLHAKSVTEMKHLGQDTPYTTISLRGASVVTSIVLPYSSLSNEFPLIRQLWEFSMQPDHLALVESFLQRRTQTAVFDRTSLNSIKETPLIESAIPCMVIGPLQQSRSLVMVTDAHIYVQPLVQDAGQSKSSKFVVSYTTKSFANVMKRRHHLRHVAVEVFFKDPPSTGNSSIFLSFDSTESRDLLYNALVDRADLRQPSLSAMTDSWVSGSMSNFDYLMCLNRFAGRSYLDFTAYHVFPWVLADYTSPELDLNDPRVYRDLSKPVGALNPDRLDKFRQRLREMPADVPGFLYGTHYSTPGYVVYYLVRSHPEYMLSLQSGRFDTPDRLFLSVNETWRSCNHNQADVKELIPEFYDVSQHPAFLDECASFLGHRADGTAVGRVVLPPWADNSPSKFISRMREALDSPYVSERLHQWIDLIFGYKQRGDEAVAADNLFYHLTYEGAVDFDAITDTNEQRSFLAQIQEFGQTPAQLFSRPHPRWNPAKPSLSPAPDDTLVTAPSSDWDIVETIPNRLRFLECIKDGTAVWSRESFAFHSDRVTCSLFDPVDQDLIVSVSRDGSLKAVTVPDRKLIRSCYPGTPGLALSCLCAASVVKQSTVLRLFVCGSVDSKLHIYCSNAGQIVQTLPFAHDDTPTDCQWSAFHQQLASCALDATVKIWDFSSAGIAPVPVHVYTEHEAPVLCLDWHGPYLATGCASRNISIWDPRAPTSAYSYTEVHDGSITDLSWISESQLVSCSSDFTVQITDIRARKALSATRLPSGPTCAKSIGPMTAVGSVDGRLYLCDNHAGLTYRQVLCTENSLMIDSLDVSDDCGRICAAGDTVTVWTQPPP